MRVRVPLLPAIVRWSAVLGVAGFVFYVSVLTVPPETAIDTVKPSLIPLDKWRHFLAYAGLGGTLAYAIVDWELDTRWAVLVVLGVVVTYGFGVELAQTFRPNRYFSLGDAYANALGGVLVLPWFWLRQWLTFVSVGAWIGQFGRGSRDG